MYKKEAIYRGKRKKKYIRNKKEKNSSSIKNILYCV